MIQQHYREQDIPYEDLAKVGLATDGKINLNEKDLTALLAGRRTDMLRLQNLFSDGLHIPFLDAKLSLKADSSGELSLLVHPIYKLAEKPSFLSEQDAAKLEKGEVANISDMLYDEQGHAKDVLVEFDQETNEFIVTDQARIPAPDRINGEYLSLDQKERYRKGKEVELPDGTTIQYSATEKNGVRSNKLAFIASVLIDGGLSFALYYGLHALFGQKKHTEDADVYSKGYYQDLEQMQENKENPQIQQERQKQYSRSYSRTNSR